MIFICNYDPFGYDRVKYTIRNMCVEEPEMQGKVEICGVNTAKLPILKEEEKEALFARIKEGDEEAKDAYIKGKKEMLRVLKTPEGEICLDTTGKKNGRGAYICRQKECLQKARKNKGLERSFKMSISPESYDMLEKEFDQLETE